MCGGDCAARDTISDIGIDFERVEPDLRFYIFVRNPSLRMMKEKYVYQLLHALPDHIIILPDQEHPSIRLP